jgi:hypothetical protein
VRNAKAGQVQFRVDKAGIIHGTIGRRSFDSDKLKGNLRALIEALNKAKPATSKGIYLRKVAVSSTMGVGVRVDLQSMTRPPAAGDANGLPDGGPATTPWRVSGKGSDWWAAPVQTGAGHPRPLVVTRKAP